MWKIERKSKKRQTCIGIIASVSFINSSNACAHIDDLDTVIKGIKTLLAPDGIFSIEVGYFADVLKNIYFDTIYHEHLDYHILGPFINLLKRTLI